MNILVTGATGMLGRTVVEAWRTKFFLFGTASRPADTDFPNDVPFLPFSLLQEDFDDLARFCTPDVIVHCAALTDHHLCEAEPPLAHAINAEATAKLARTFPTSFFIYISTDAVFGGEAVFPDETVPPAPFSVYGRTKHVGELLLRRETPNSITLRTTIVGLGGRRKRPGLAEWILAELRFKRPLRLYMDALFTPIAVWDFIPILEWCLVERPQGMLHATGSERLSKYDFGVMLAEKGSFDTTLIQPALLAESEDGKVRRLDQSISSRKLERLSGIPLPGAEACVSAIIRRSQCEIL